MAITALKILADFSVGAAVGGLAGLLSHDEMPESGIALTSTTASYWGHAIACYSERLSNVLDNLPLYKFDRPISTAMGVYAGASIVRSLRKNLVG